MSEVEAAVDPRDERFRLAVIAASIPLLLLTAPCYLTVDHDRSLIGEARGELVPILMIAAFFVWPVFVGLLGFVRALRRKPPPGKVAFGVPAALHGIGAAILLVMLGMAFIDRERTREAPAVWGALVAWSGVVVMVVRGIVRSGWERWASLIAAVWMLYAGGVMIVEADQSSMLASPPQAMWVMLFGLGAAVAPLGWAMGPRRG